MARYTDNAQTERQGINFVSAVCEEMRYIWRQTPNADVGIDGEIELVAGVQATGQIIKVQCKAGKSYLANEKANQFDFYADANQLEYWKGATNPIILVVYDPGKQLGYWVDVKRYIDKNPEIISERPHKIVFDKSLNLFSRDSAECLQSLVRGRLRSGGG